MHSRTFWGCPDHARLRLKSQAKSDPSGLPAAHDAEVKRALALLNVPLSMATPLAARIRIRMKSSARHCEQSELGRASAA
jgi:hypothetical protein